MQIFICKLSLISDFGIKNDTDHYTNTEECVQKNDLHP